MEILKLENIHKSFNKREVLKGISLSLHRGEIFGFIGPNGAGKSTTMKIIMGFIKPSSGKVFIFGKENTDSNLKREVGFLPEHPYFYTNVTGKEFLKFVRLVSGVEPKEFWNRVDIYGKKLEISWALDKKLSEYSKGMLQRFGILQTVVCEPELIILDEPMSGLDPIGRRIVMDLILELKANGKTVFFSTHILPDVQRVCDRVGVIVGGRLTDIVEGKDIENIEELFLERVKEAGLKEVL
ncbi:ABC-2 type transport system ATP-binding protein [Hydrogenivirga caldilitoris]|uniref:ABC-2 type transport system ATP-binding protein n=1 Tax=Hydrogenivirga caldilitoris TaxID=246264 RepID=A0A497XRU2_9AQUI|nr:ABC transporter ATP-binding protein [Hydrogenivirga caldilitoris]RLJ70991.1 ABC-2 type transport system ATP-binding protein [Hydrogenivirga caldilitoris]